MSHRLVGAACASAAVLALLAPGASASKPAPKKHFQLVPHLCAWVTGAAASLELSGGCHEKRGHTKTAKTPFGNASLEVFVAEWGVPNAVLLPQHILSVSVFHETGSGPIVAYLEQQARLKVLEEGVPVASPKGVTASWSGDTYSCQNPPTDDCTKSEFNAVRGAWAVFADVQGAPPGSSGSAEQNEDDPQDLQQEEVLRPATVGAGLAVAAKL